MVNIAFPASEICVSSCGHFLTFVVLASDGCNLKCSFCVISQRREITTTTRLPDDFSRFIREVAEKQTVLGISLQGYEPLLPAALPYTMSILRTAAALDVPAGLVTNGTHLAEALPKLLESPPGKIAVSLDAATPEKHDKIRGVRGAWGQTVSGIRAALRKLDRGSPSSPRCYPAGARTSSECPICCPSWACANGSSPRC